MAGGTRAMTNRRSDQAGESWRTFSTFRKRGQRRLCSRSSSIAEEIRQKTGVSQAPMPTSAAVAFRLEQTHTLALSLEIIATR